MKRCLIPGILALSIHGLLFAMDFSWSTGESLFHPKEPAVTLTLTYIQPEKPRPVATIPKPAPAPEKIIKKEKTIKPTLKSPPKREPDLVHRPMPQPDLTPIRLSEPQQLTEKIASRIEQKPVHEHLEAIETFSPVALTRSAAQQPKTQPPPVIREARPLYRRNPPPRYPQLARKRKYQGVVVLEVLVSRDGSVGGVKVFKSSGYAILDKSAIKSVKKWEFEPGRRGNNKVDRWIRVPVRFQLK